MGPVARLAMVTVVIGVLLVAPSVATTAHACSCGALTDEEFYAMADVVFVGQLDEIRTSDELTFASDDPARFLFTVETVFKGEAFEQQSVVTDRDGASCGLEIAPGTKALVFAEVSGRNGLAVGELTSNLCTGTRAVGAEAVGDDVVPAAFAGAVPPLTGSSGIGDGNPLVPTAQDLVRGLIGGGIVLAALVLATVGIVRGRRDRRGSSLDTP